MRGIVILCVVIISCGLLTVWPADDAATAVEETPQRPLGLPHPGLVAALQLMISLLALIGLEEDRGAAGSQGKKPGLS